LQQKLQLSAILLSEHKNQRAPQNFKTDFDFSPITPVCSINFSATVIPLKSEAKNSSLVLYFNAFG
jgi:hypothetical protein